MASAIANVALYCTDSIFSKYASPPEQGGRGGVSTPSPPKKKFSVDAPFLLMSPSNVFFLKEVTKNVLENQQAKSRAS